MTFTQFKYLSEDDQEALLWRRGVELGRTRDDIFHYILYQVDGFYMEVKYIMPQRTIREIACFEDVDLIAPYLDTINITSLLRA
ncbi:MAG TPA: hypothetical protein VGO58_19770 [Chitinophagaceae bacterium]|jgi:hypothetical protein|nr:hypothetical protein [Chitinophagaceae bacterium]